jgi:exopolyphosphatase/guanosine-5'-triphosphate,3'-diphosphate pyrophosphatase
MSRFAAIDVGSNAMRLMIARIAGTEDDTRLYKEAFFRVPLRLGSDVFSRQRLSKETQIKLMKTMVAFRNLVEVFEPLSLRACATSAMRDSLNGADTVAAVEKQTGIRLDIISGSDEAELIFSTHIRKKLDPDKAYLFIDVGGGSTELMLHTNGRVARAHSFNIGTVRMLNSAVDPAEWDAMQDWLRTHLAGVDASAIGSGGNINRLNRLAKKDENRILTRSKLQQLYKKLSNLDVNERISTFRIKPDRAEVIVPAAQIYLQVMKWGGIQEIMVPKFGLVDGLVYQQYQEYMQNGNGQRNGD